MKNSFFNVDIISTIHSDWEYLSTITSDKKDYAELKYKINCLNEYQFIYFCMKVFYHIPVRYWSMDALNLLFLKEKKSSSKTTVNLNCTPKLDSFINFTLNINSFFPEQSIIQLIKEASLTEIRASFWQSVFAVKTYFLNYFDELDESDSDHFIYYYQIIEKLSLLEEKADSLAALFQEKIEELSETSEKLNFNYDQKPLDYNFQIVYPIIHSLNEWKELALKKIISCKNPEKFYSTKSFFKECLNQYKKLTSKEYIDHRYIYKSKQKLKSNFLESYSEVNKMIEWLDSTFISPENIAINEQFKFIDEVNEKIKLTISNDYSQRMFLNLFEEYFKTNGSEYNSDQLYSMVFHFTKIEHDKLGRPAIISKKLRNPVSIQYIDFITKENTRDIIKIFLLLKKGKIIETGITELISIIVHILKEVQTTGISESNIKKIWAASAEDKKGIEFLLTSNIRFNKLLFINCPNIKKLLKKQSKNININN